MIFPGKKAWHVGCAQGRMTALENPDMMISFFRKSILAAAFLFCCFTPATGQDLLDLRDPITFTEQDRVLVIAPHPDDESIGMAGVIQQALKAGARVKVCLMTYGENNEFSFIVYERRIVLKPKEFLRLGEVRHHESLDAMALLGVAPENLIALGYPDYGTLEMFLRYWGDVKPFRSMLSRVRAVPFEDALSPKSPYVAESVLMDLKRVIGDFRPTKIFVSSPTDVNRDHQAAYLFTQVALWDLQTQQQVPPSEVFSYIIHVPGWPAPRGYFPELPQRPPQSLEKNGMSWIEQPLDPEEISRKHEAILRYPTQVKYAPKYLVSFARRNELFEKFPALVLGRQLASDPELLWSQVGVNEPPRGRIKSDATDHFAEVAYARQGNYLVTKVVLKRASDKEFGISVFLMGYNPRVPFAQMPKISLLLGLNGFYVKDKKKTIPSKDVIFIEKEKEFIFKVPLSLLGDPDRILTSAKTAVYDLTLHELAWRVLELP